MQNFIENVMRITNCTKAEAKRVHDLYLKEKIAKYDSRCNGSLDVKHGVFWEKDVLENAIAMTA